MLDKGGRNEAFCFVIDCGINSVRFVANHSTFISTLCRASDDATLATVDGVCVGFIGLITLGVLLPTDSLTLIWKNNETIYRKIFTAHCHFIGWAIDWLYSDRHW
jgi:hypothetical protein